MTSLRQFMPARRPSPDGYVSAILGKAKLLGLEVDRPESSASAGAPVEREMTDLEMARRLTFALDRADRQLETLGQDCSR